MFGSTAQTTHFAVSPASKTSQNDHIFADRRRLVEETRDRCQLGNVLRPLFLLPPTAEFAVTPKTHLAQKKVLGHLSACLVTLFRSGYDGGDCCECTCVSTSEIACGDSDGFDCIDPDSSCEENLVEAVTKTTIGVSTNTFDTRVGEALGGVGCGQDGCGPELTRDGSVDLESRWACAQKLNPGGGLCEIGFVFEDPQDIFEVEVAFFKGDERSRTLQVGKTRHDKERKIPDI